MHHTTERSASGGVRFNVTQPPSPGQKLILTDGAVVTFDGIGMAGMLSCTDADGVQSLLFPHQVARIVGQE